MDNPGVSTANRPRVTAIASSTGSFAASVAVSDCSSRAAGAAAAQDYVENRYHGPKDEYDPNWNWAGVMADLRLYYRVGRELAMTGDWPNWVPGDEFRAIRDESAAQRK